MSEIEFDSCNISVNYMYPVLQTPCLLVCKIYCLNAADTDSKTACCILSRALKLFYMKTYTGNFPEQ
jgi:hypothetical protein